MREYRVGEIFKHDGFTYQCVEDDPTDCIPSCVFCDGKETFCSDTPCSMMERADKKATHFIRVTKPKVGMLFRASDGVLYEARDKETNDKCHYCCIRPVLGCNEIGKQAFGKLTGGYIHWYPIEKKKEKKEKKHHLEIAVVKADKETNTTDTHGMIRFKVHVGGMNKKFDVISLEWKHFNHEEKLIASFIDSCGIEYVYIDGKHNKLEMEKQ